jgi:hypothetical protein
MDPTSGVPSRDDSESETIGGGLGLADYGPMKLETNFGVRPGGSPPVLLRRGGARGNRAYAVGGDGSAGA